MKHRDKLLHFFAGFGLFMLGVLILHVPFGWALCVVGAVMKEGYDSFHGSKSKGWSYADIVATLAGGAVGHLVVWGLM